MKNTIVLAYHNIVKGHKLKLYDVSLEAFKKQLSRIKLSHQLSVQEPALNQSQKLKIVITFDDGYRGWVDNALEPILENGLCGIFFVCVDHILNGNITKEGITLLKKSNMIIGSHSLTHSFLHTFSPAKLMHELSKSKEILEDIIKEEVSCFSVPRGMYNRLVIRAARKSGYKRFFTSDIGLNRQNAFLIKRIPVKRYTSIEDFTNILNARNLWNMAVFQWAKDRAKRILGIKNYNRLRQFAIKDV
ncbi:MAG: polysaccharide deacetylase family protein [Candidatus Omnitrophota bacterium]